MRRVALALAGLAAGTTLLISLKSAPGASRTPDQVVADELQARRAANPAVSGTPGTDPSPSATPGLGGALPPTGPGTGATVSPGRSSAPGTAAAPGPAPTTTTARPPAPGPGGGASAVSTGNSAFTEFGYVTVAITVANGRITDVVAVELPGDEARSVSISNQAGPQLRQRALAAQGTNFDTVSGATWTSDAFKQSLRSAMGKAGLG